MNYLLKITFILFASLQFSASDAEAIRNATSTPSPEASPIDEAFNCVYQIKTATEADAPKSSYGSGFVIDKNGVLATNYHVVSDALQKPEHYKVFLVDDGVNTEATVVRFSAVDDIAIVRVPKTFSCALKFAKSKPSIGQRINSIGLPEDLNKSIIEGTYNGQDTAGPYSQIQMSSPLNSGMSGGPTINKNGEVIGLNVAILNDAQSLAFAVPLNRLEKLLAEPESIYPEKDNKDTFHPSIQAQMVLAQDRLISDFDIHAKAPHKIGDWTLPHMPTYYKCWRTSEPDAKDRTSSTSEICFLTQSVHLGSRSRSSFIKTQWTAIENKKLSTLQFFNLLDIITHAISSNVSGNFPDPNDAPPFVGGTCRNDRVTNKNNLLFAVKYCLNGFKKIDGLLEARVVATTIDSASDAISYGLEMSGFSESNIEKILLSHLDGLQRGP